jgi:hypothetical protein
VGVRSWLRTPAAREVVELRADIHRLTATIERLEAIQRKDAEQLKRLQRIVEDGTAAWRQAVTDASAATADVQRAADLHRRRDYEGILERLDEGRKTDAKWRKIFNNQISALVRHVCLPLDKLRPPQSLNARRFRLRSQNEEDGILFALLGQAGWGGQRFVEIGSGKSGGTAASLAHECGWSGLMIESSAASVELARRKFAGNRGVTAISAHVTPDNVNVLLTQNGYTGEIDLLSLDIDSYDYWVFEALTAASPRVLVLEYNALFGPERRVTIPLGQSLDSTPKGYGGASLAALTELARRKGFRLVACENAGVNAFFLRDDVASHLPGVTPAEAFKPLRSRVDLDDAEVKADIYAAAEKLRLPLVDV